MFTPESNRPTKADPFFDLWGRLSHALIAFSTPTHESPQIYASVKLGDLSISRFEHVTTVSDHNNHWELDAEIRTLQHIAFPNGTNKTELPQIVVEQFSFRHLAVAIGAAVQAKFTERDRQSMPQIDTSTGVNGTQTPAETASMLMEGTKAWLEPPTSATTNLQNVA